MPEKKVIIAGPGRVGATLLMKILTELGFDTGFSKGTDLHHTLGCRFEWPMRGNRMELPIPYIVKEPQMCTDIDLRIERFGWQIDHIYVMLRRPGPIAPALDFLAKGKPRGWEKDMQVRSLEKSERGFSRRINQVIHLIAEMDVPHTLVSFPRWADDPGYGYSKFEFLMDKGGISFDEFNRVRKECVDMDTIKKVRADMPEWLRTYMREWIT